MISVETVGKIRRWYLVKGESISKIARKTGLSRNTVKRYLRNATTGPEQVQPRANAMRRAAGATATPPQQEMASNRTEPFPPNALLRLKDVCRLVGLSRSSIYKRVADGTFPRPLRVSERSARWRMQDLQEWTIGLAEP